MLTKIKLMIAAAVVLMAFGGGWTVRDWRCDAAEQKQRAELAEARTAQLEENMKRIAVVTGVDAGKVIEDAAELERLEGIIRDAKDKISAGVCFDGADADRVRSLWQ